MPDTQGIKSGLLSHPLVNYLLLCLIVAVGLTLVGCTVEGGGGGGGTGGNENANRNGNQNVNANDNGAGNENANGNGNQNANQNDNSDGGEPVDFGVVLGRVKDGAGNPLSGVAVTAGALTTTSNEQGFFSVDNVPQASRLVVGFNKQGYAPTADIVAVRTGDSSFVDAVMLAEEQVEDLDATDGGTVTTPDGGSVVIPGGSLVDAQGHPYTGTARVALTTFDPTNEADRDAFPGDFVGIAEGGESVPMVSYGLMNITIVDPAGNALGLAAGGTAQIVIPIPTGLVGSAPDTMPLWYFDEDDGRWHEDGLLTRDGNVYRSPVTHLSIFNSDVGMNRSYVNGRVLDCVTGQPIEGAQVEIVGISPRNCWRSGERSTSALGIFRNPDDPDSAQYDGIPVDADSECEIWASKNGVESERTRFTSLPVGGILDFGDICLNVPRIRITLTWGAEPGDLDAHLTFPLADGTRGHVYYDNKTAGGVTLDTDDQDGYGPEIITVYALNDGMYRYSVHHYGGSSTISTSGASVSMIIDQLGIYNLTPPSGASGERDAWRLWEITVQNGAVTDVSVKNEYFPEVGATDTTIFKLRK